MKVDFGGAQRPPLAVDEKDTEYGTADDAFWGTPEDKVLVFNEANKPNYIQYFEFIARHHFAKLDGITIPASVDTKLFKVKNGTLTELTAAGKASLSGQGKAGILVLPSEIKVIGEQVFSESVKNFRFIYAEGVEEVKDGSFNMTGALLFAHLPKLKRVGNETFTDNASLIAVNFPYLTEIGDASFCGGSDISNNGLNMSYVSIPAAKKIGRGSFQGNYKKSGVTFLLGAQPEVNMTPYPDYPFENFVAFGKLKSPVLYVTPADKASYTITDGKWHGFTIKEKK